MYDDDLYLSWEWKLPKLEQFPYAGMDFRGDNDLVLPPGGAWGASGILVFQVFKFLSFFYHKDIYICIRVFNPFNV